MRQKKCKICKETFTPQRPLQMVCGYKCSHEYAKLQKQKAWAKERKERLPEVYPQKFRKTLNTEIQKLSRMIDKKYGVISCIDCSKPLPTKHDGGHFHTKGSNASIAWNLHNIHSQRSECNMPDIGGGRRLEYYDGLVSRYSQKYADYVRYDIIRLYPSINVSNKEVAEKINLVRKLTRNLHTYSFKNPIDAREQMNQIIGIYTSGYSE